MRFLFDDALIIDALPGIRRADGAVVAANTFAREVRRVAIENGPKRSILVLCARAFLREWSMRLLRRVTFRLRDNKAACDAYDSMTLDDFAAINAPQAWANWRTIPHNLRGRLPRQPVTAVDLCCGTGDSTAVLAYYCPVGSHIIGLEWSRAFVEAARRRKFIHAGGSPGNVSFSVQDVLTEFRDAAGCPIKDAAVDLVHCQGAVGSHFDDQTLRCLASNCDRVLRPGGLIMLDTRRRGDNAAQILAAWSSYGYDLVSQAQSCRWDRFIQICLRKRSARNQQPELERDDAELKPI